MRLRRWCKLVMGAGLVTLLLGVLMVLAPGAGADDFGPVPDGAVLLPEDGGRVPICHATSSETQPYIRNAPSVNAAGELFDANHASHTGPVFAPGMRSAQPKIQWGDIIPPIAVDGRLVFQGSANWLDGGAAQYPVCSAVTEPADPVVVVEKDVPGATDTTEFAFTLDGYGDEPTLIAEGESFETRVDAGTITVTEDGAAGYTLTDVECTRSYVAEGELIEDEEMSDEWSGEGRSATFEARAGDVITCVFTNTPDA